MIEKCITNVVTDAVFSDSITRKARVLELGAIWLHKAPEPALKSLFAEVIGIVKNDQFSEVNLLVSPLVQSQDAIPEELHWKYVEALLAQSQSSSFYGAPAAQRGLAQLPGTIMSSIHTHITAATLARIDIRSGMRILLQNPTARTLYIDQLQLIDDFLTTDHLTFVQKYSKPDDIV